MIEVLVAIALLLIIFLFITSDLIQASQAENVSATRTESMDAANYLLGVMRTDSGFWGTSGSSNDWSNPGPNIGINDPCGNPWPPYTDSITAPTWHQAPACAPSGSNPGIFPDLVGTPIFQYMWNAQQQAGNSGVAQLTVWVQVAEGNRLNVYELNSTRGDISAQPSNSPVVPSPPLPTKTPKSPPPTGPTPSPGSPTPKPSPHSPPPSKPPTATPSPVPSGTFM